MSKAMTHSNSWFCLNGLELSDAKTRVVIFGRQRTLPKGSIKLDNKDLPIKENTRYLGFELDNRLKWTKHINHIIKKCERYLNVLRLLVKVKWGADRFVAKLFYNSCIRSQLDYGGTLFGAAQANQLKRITIIQNKALRICVGAMNSTPVEAIYVEANEPPLVLRRQFLAFKYILKLKTSSDHSNILNNTYRLSVLDLTAKYWAKKPSPPLAIAFRHLATFTKPFKKPEFPKMSFFQYFSPLQIVFPNYTENLRQNKLIHLELTERLTASTIIYTDASKSLDGCGCAFFDATNNVRERFKLADTLTIFSAEAKAILEALKYVYRLNTPSVVIMSDSKSVLEALKHRKYYLNSHPLILQIINEYVELVVRQINVSFFWIKAHSDITPNEIVDQLAKTAVELDNITDNNIYYPEILCIAKKYYLKDKWQRRWEASYMNNMTQYALIHPSIPQNHWHTYHSVPREFCSTIARLKFGHGTYPKHLFKINIINSPACKCGWEVADLDHIVLACREHSAQREVLFQSLQNLQVAFPTKLVPLLASNDERIYRAIYTFLKSSAITI